MKSPHVLIIVTSHNRINDQKPTGIWFEEFATPYAQFRQAGFAITVASPKGGQAPIDPRSMPADTANYGDALSALANTITLGDVDANAFDAVFLPGGHGTMFDMPTAEVGAVIGKFADANKVIGAVCHGPAGLVNAYRADGTPVVAGLRLTSFTNEEEDAAQLTKEMPFLLESKLIQLGARFEGTTMWADHVIVDGLLVTGQNPQSSHSTATALIGLLNQQTA
jgi:putative intracellular protease/amidase